MTQADLDYEVGSRAIREQLPAGPRCVVIGSTALWGCHSGEICGAIGRLLARLDGMILVTGGMTGVGEAVGRSFFAERETVETDAAVYHVLPRGCRAWDYGVTLFGGSSMGERREILGRLARIYVAIEGGPGTEHEAAVAIQQGAIVIPVGRTGGISANLHPRLRCPLPELHKYWSDLGSSAASIREVASSVCAIVNRLNMRGGVECH